MRNSLFSLRNKDIPFKEYSNYPPVLRDLSILADSSVKEGELEKVILASKHGGLLKKIRLYDIYKPKSDGAKISYTFSLEFRSDEKTLTNEEVNRIQEQIVLDLNKKLNAELRK